MVDILTDPMIDSLVTEKKELPTDYHSKIQVRPKRGHKERELDLKGEGGNDFHIILRQSIFKPLDFSIIMAIRKILQSSARDLERTRIQVQIVCTGRLFKTDKVWKKPGGIGHVINCKEN